MSLLLHKDFCPDIDVNGNIEDVEQIQLTARATAPTDADLANGRLYYDSALAVFRGRVGGSWVTLSSTASGVVGTWDEIYDNDKTLLIDNGVLTFQVTTAANGLYLNKTNSGAGAVLVIGNSGSGNDITGPAWSIISTGSVGILELTSTGTINATGGALSIGKTGTATTFVGTATVDEGLTVAAGGAAITSTSNSGASLSVTNATVSSYSSGAVQFTFAGLTTGKGIVVTATSVSTGSLLRLVGNAAFAGGGLYLNCYNGSSADFTIGVGGTTAIAGVAATNAFTLTAGDMVMSDGSITLTDADNAASLTVTNATASSASGVVVITAAGQTSGTVLSVTGGGTNLTTSGAVIAAAMGASLAGNGITVVNSGAYTGTGLVVLTANSLTTGLGLSIVSSATAITTTGRLLSVAHTGATGTSAVLSEFISAANDETVILAVTASAANALGTAFQITSATTTGYAQTITANSLTSGSALLVTSASASTSGSSSFEPALFTTTMTGIGGVGGRVRAYMTTNVALGAWSNALKGQVVYGAAGRTAGLGSAICAEMTLSAGTTPGTYAPLELELNLGAGAVTGAASSLIYASVNQTGGNTAFDTAGYLFNIAGLTAGTTKLLQTGTTFHTPAATLKVMVGSTVYYLPLYSGEIT